MAVESVGGAIFIEALRKGVGFVDLITSLLFEELANWERAFVTLYIVLAGIQLLRGTFGEKSKEVVASIIFLAIYQAIAVETDGYKEWVTDPILTTVYNTAAWLTTLGVGGNQGIEDVFIRLDAVLQSVFVAIDNMQDSTGILDSIMQKLEVGLVTITLLALFAAVYFTYLGLMLISILTLVVLFTLGPIFMFFLCFKETRFIGWAWVKGLANYSMLGIVGSIAIAITIAMIQDSAASIRGMDPAVGLINADIGAALLTAAMSLYLLLKSPDVAALLTGGAAGNTALLSGALGAAGAKMTTMVKGGAGGAWNSKAGKASRAWAGNKVLGAAGAAMSYGLDSAQRAGRAFSARKGVQR